MGVYGMYIDGFLFLNSTVVQVYRLLQGDLDVQKFVEFDALRAMALLILFYACFTFFILNVFVTIVVDAYYVTRLTSIPGPSWSAQRWFQWATPGLCFQLVQAANQYSVKTDSSEGTS